MTLPELIHQALGLTLPSSLPAQTVTGIAQDSKRVQPGYIFVARRGAVQDGHYFADKAIAQGAIAIVGTAFSAEVEAFPWRWQVPYIKVEDDKKALAQLAAAFHGYPSHALTNIGVTGTDGKTTTAYLLHHLLSERHRTGLLSTAAIRIAEETLEPEGHFTSPEASEVQASLARFRDASLSHAVIEASSHGLAMHRLDSIAYAVGVWTNLSPEHLDYHGSFEAYRQAKTLLMQRSDLSVLNGDDPSCAVFAAASQKVVRYGIEAEDLDWRASQLESSSQGSYFQLEVKQEGKQEASSFSASAFVPLPGRYNVYNALAALAAAHACGSDLHSLLARLAEFPGVPGRMQVVQQQPFTVIVDFAHTPAALQTLLETVRPLYAGQCILVIGAAGERDPSKRQPLGNIAVRLSDFVIFTEEDSRSEDVEKILAQLVQGAEEAGGRKGQDFCCFSERRAAISHAMRLAQPGDVVLLCGKGHERSLERNHSLLPWDEVAEAQAALAALHNAD